MACILVIDDDPDVRTILHRMLAHAGYAVVEASTGREGVAACQTHPIDLIITDIVMPDQDGFETLRALQALMPPAVKIIVISGGGRLANLDLLTQAKLLGAHQTLQMSIRRQDLLTAVQTLLAGP